MQRRDFLAASASAGIGLAATQLAVAGHQDARVQSLGRSARLTPPADGPVSVAVAISDATTHIDWVGPESVFQIFVFDPAKNRHVPRFKQHMVSHALQLTSGFMPRYTFDNVPNPNVVVVPSQLASPELLDWLRKVHETADVIMSVCGGVKLLAKAGLLDGQSAACPSEDFDQVTKRFPKVKWVRGMRFVEGPKISTSAAGMTGIDLALRVRDRYFGREDAQQAADHLEYQSPSWKVG